MEDIANKISEYDILNTLLPGVIFNRFLELILDLSLSGQEIICNFFVYYFIGLVISRIGSLAIDEVFAKLNIVKKANYESFIKSEKKDKKIKLLLARANSYRTFVALFLVLLVTEIAYSIIIKKSINTFSYIVTIIMIIVFTLSYIKQTNYIVNRVSYNESKQ